MIMYRVEYWFRLTLYIIVCAHLVDHIDLYDQVNEEKVEQAVAQAAEKKKDNKQPKVKVNIVHCKKNNSKNIMYLYTK